MAPRATPGRLWGVPGGPRGAPGGCLGALLAPPGSLCGAPGVPWLPGRGRMGLGVARGGPKPQKVMTLLGIVRSDPKKVMTFTGMEDPRRSEPAFWPLRRKKVTTVVGLEHSTCSEPQFWRGRFRHPCERHHFFGGRMLKTSVLVCFFDAVGPGVPENSRRRFWVDSEKNVCDRGTIFGTIFRSVWVAICGAR